MKTRNTHANCGNCPYWDRFKPPQTNYGRCRCGIPVSGSDWWPHSELTDWCGEHPDFWATDSVLGQTDPSNVQLPHRNMDIKIVKSEKRDFIEHVGPSSVTHVFLSINTKLFELGRFYQGPYENDGVDEQLKIISEFESWLKDITK